MIIAKMRLITKLSLIMAFCSALNLNSFESSGIRSGLSDQLRNGFVAIFGVSVFIYNLYNRKLSGHAIETINPLVSEIDKTTDPDKLKKLVQEKVKLTVLHNENLFLRSLDKQRYDISQAIWDKFIQPGSVAVQLVKDWAFPDSKLTKEEISAKVEGSFLEFLFFVLEQPIKDNRGINRVKFFVEQVKKFKLCDNERRQILDKVSSLGNHEILSYVQGALSPVVDKKIKKRVTFDSSVKFKD